MTGAAQDWRTMPAGRELDAVIAERWMGWSWMRHTAPEHLPAHRWLAPPEEVGDFGHVRPADMSEPQEEPWWLNHDGQHIGPNEWRVPHFSTDLAAAGLVMERLAEDGLSVVIATNGAAPRQNGAKVFHAFRALGVDMFDAQRHEGWHAIAETVPLAIVRAALAATEARP